MKETRKEQAKRIVEEVREGFKMYGGSAWARHIQGDLVKFGNYLLSEERLAHFDEEAIALGVHKEVNHADLENYIHKVRRDDVNLTLAGLK
jgi:hypothetical protein